MKKNKMMRIASILMVATLITTCAISGTFAKYVTKAEGADQARVAKWGIVLTMEGDNMFAPEYKADDKTFAGSDENQDPVLSVRVDPDYLENATEKSITDLVAPGTTNNGFKATIKGKPEVAVRYTLHIDKDWTDVVLPHGEYTDFTQMVPKTDAQTANDPEYGYYGKFTLDKDYAPVKWDITVAKNGGTPISLVAFARQFNATLADQMGMTKDGFAASDAKTIVETYGTQLQNLILAMINNEGEAGASNAVFTIAKDGGIDLSIDFDPNRSLGFEFGLVWTWAFEGEDDEDTTEVDEALLVDQADTWLGNYAAFKEFGELTEYAEEFNNAKAVHTIGFNFVASATQID
jgi:hypothetical protein